MYYDDENMFQQFPKLEFSYETITHKKIPFEYDICLAIPHAKKCVLWFTFHEGKNKCVLVEINRSKEITKMTTIKVSYRLDSLYLGTILYGSIMHESLFVIEDIFIHCGVSLNKLVFGEKLGIIESFLDKQSIINENTSDISFFLPVFWKSHLNDDVTEIPAKKISYPLHHVQYRSLNYILPYLNVIPRNFGFQEIPTSIKTQNVKSNKNSHCRQEKTKYICTFIVMADLRTDVYNLFACDENETLQFYDIAYIPNCKSSVYMNSLFRHIKENQNIDFIEESDDEAEFQDVRDDKYVDTLLSIAMNCVYHTKFRRWVPIQVIHAFNDISNIEDYASLVSITKLPKL